MDARFRGRDDPEYFLLPHPVIPVQTGIHAVRKLPVVLSE
jgi:hypothetical protein